MSARTFCRAAAALSISLAVMPAFSQTAGSSGGPPTATLAPRNGAGAGTAYAGAEPCSHSPICGWSKGRNLMVHEQHTPDLGFTIAYPFSMPDGSTGGVVAVAINSHQHLFAFQRNPAGKPQLFEFDQNHKLVRTIAEDVIGHQNKAHGMAIDAEDNVWICDEHGDTVMKLSPEGKLLMTLGVKGQRGDWDEAKGQRLLWQPLQVAFGKNGDVYIAMGHGNESPNDTDKSPTNSSGAARILHLDKNGKFIQQWFGNSPGPGHFSMAHAIAINPNNGNVYIGDREEYRIVVYDPNGKFIRTIQTRNLVCTLYVDPHNQLWMATGQDGQVFKIDWDGNVLGAIGNGPGRGEGQFSESAYMAMDSQGDLYVGDTAIPRITEMVAPKQ
ncbi:MAG: 6-bladed beta-propeller [Acidobacteriia bacterium]|nr:6-bladed beta-propeller [Terriglobia bacterium]